MSNLISVEELRSRLGEHRLRVVDTRFDLADVGAGERHYLDGHVPGAIYAHLDRDLSGPLGDHGGRHPLPDPEALARRLGRMGIGNEHFVVAYDEVAGMYSSRLWWLLRWLGHADVRVLDGGFRAWREAGMPTREGVEEAPATDFRANPRPEMIISRESLLERLGDPGFLLIDARAPERYSGEVEPIDPVAGHIPGAINIPFAGNLSAGRMLPPEELRTRFRRVETAQEAAVYCGSGVSAAHDILAMAEAGIEGVRLYPGSWSDWVSYPEAPLETGPGRETSD